jgi:hypothetical protein
MTPRTLPNKELHGQNELTAQGDSESIKQFAAINDDFGFEMKVTATIQQTFSTDP